MQKQQTSDIKTVMDGFAKQQETFAKNMNDSMSGMLGNFLQAFTSSTSQPAHTFMPSPSSLQPPTNSFQPNTPSVQIQSQFQQLPNSFQNSNHSNYPSTPQTPTHAPHTQSYTVLQPRQPSQPPSTSFRLPDETPQQIMSPPPHSTHSDTNVGASTSTFMQNLRYNIPDVD